MTRRNAEMTRMSLLMLALAATALPLSAWARSSDRNQPMDIDAGRQAGALDDSTPTVLSGGVIITQGTLNISSSTATITARNGEISRAVFNGAPVKLSQQMDDGTPMNASASKVDYDMSTETVVFTGNVQIAQPRGTMSGQRVVYNMKSGQVQSGGEGAGRVKMRILPKSAQGKPSGTN
ncbi:MAG: lipopolysaccharide transport periplasmic protein LptA [Pseudomonadota bacterium]|nr:lipopolysaccharide transport periplasmic protein LptA [Pseudomonadota bacterium]